jgi:SAM-dependent methyltransferase
MRDMEFSGEFDLALNLFSSIGFFTDDEDRLLLDRFCTGLKPGGAFVLDTRNRDFVIHDVTPEETVRLPEGTVRVKNRFDVRTSRIQQDWWLEDQQRLLGQTEIRLYSVHELLRMLRPERWSQVELFGGLDGRPFLLESPRIVLVATK